MRVVCLEKEPLADIVEFLDLEGYLTTLAEHGYKIEVGISRDFRKNGTITGLMRLEKGDAYRNYIIQPKELEYTEFLAFLERLHEDNTSRVTIWGDVLHDNRKVQI